jgi:ATP-dependent protease ClpP protease subunit
MKFYAINDNGVSLFGEIALFCDFAEFREAIGDRRGLSLYVDSIGGNSAWALDALKLLRGRVSEVTVRNACSAAGIVALAGDHIRIQSDGHFMIHEPRWPIYAGRSGLLSAAEQLKSIADEIECAICRRTGIKSKIVRRWLSDGADHYFTAEQSVRLGLADEIFDAPKIRETSINTTPKPTDDGKRALLNQILANLGTITTTEREAVGRELYEFFRFNVKEAQ